MFRPEMLRPMGLPPGVRVIAWGLSLVSLNPAPLSTLLFYTFISLNFLLHKFHVHPSSLLYMDPLHS
jgi:hypothetical protein